MDALWPDRDQAPRRQPQPGHPVARKALGTGAIEGETACSSGGGGRRRALRGSGAAALRARRAGGTGRARALRWRAPARTDTTTSPQRHARARGTRRRALPRTRRRRRALRLPADASSFGTARRAEALLSTGACSRSPGRAAPEGPCLELARSVEGEFADGAAFVELAPWPYRPRRRSCRGRIRLQPLPGRGARGGAGRPRGPRGSPRPRQLRACWRPARRWQARCSAPHPGSRCSSRPASLSASR
jgi:hypothetical protein